MVAAARKLCARPLHLFLSTRGGSSAFLLHPFPSNSSWKQQRAQQEAGAQKKQPRSAPQVQQGLSGGKQHDTRGQRPQMQKRRRLAGLRAAAAEAGTHRILPHQPHLHSSIQAGAAADECQGAGVRAAIEAGAEQHSTVPPLIGSHLHHLRPPHQSSTQAEHTAGAGWGSEAGVAAEAGVEEQHVFNSLHPHLHHSSLTKMRARA